MDGIRSIPASGQLSFRHPVEVIRQPSGTRPEPEIQTAKAEAPPYVPRLPVTLNQRLEYLFNRELGQVVVKVIDTNTDTVIKELPPAEFQRMHLAIREAIGHLIDKRV